MQQILTKEGIKNILEVTKDNFICPKGEEKSYHCRIEMRQFNKDTGARISTPRLQVFGKKIFETNLVHNLRQQGYTVDILHDPNEWMKANGERVAAEKAARERAAKEAAAQREQERRAAERKALKDEIMAELEAAGLLKKPAAPKKK